VKRRTKTLAVLAVAAGLLLSASSAGAFTEADRPSSSNNKADLIRHGGSATTFQVMNALGRAYMETPGCKQYEFSFPHQNPASPGNNMFGQPLQDTNTCLPITVQQDPNTVLEENYDHDIVVGYYPSGSTGGQRFLCGQGTTNDPNHPGVMGARPAGVDPIQFARSSSGFNNRASRNPCTRDYWSVGEPVPDTNLTLRFVGFAKDALTWVAWPSKNFPGGIQNLTQAQIVGIYVDCTINDWGDLVPSLDPTWNGSSYTNTPSGQPGNIEVWTSLRQSGTREDWERFLGASGTDGRSENCIPADQKDGNPANGERIIIEHIASDIVGAGNQENAFYHFSVGIHMAKPDRAAGSVLGSINGIAPTEDNVRAGTFPTSRTVYNVYRQEGPSPLKTVPITGFVGPGGWICKAPSQHARPNGSAGAGVQRGDAIQNGGNLVRDVIEDEGFFLVNTTGNRCVYDDWNLWPTTVNKPGRAKGGNGDLIAS